MTEAAQAAPYVGQSLRRREDLKFLTGNGRYVDDINLRGILYLAILRSPHAHALITDVDLSTARAAAGVLVFQIRSITQRAMSTAAMLKT
jgi:carbon-monoxide dehydrogenase large subunit